jgi:hypothetical protein
MARIRADKELHVLSQRSILSVLLVCLVATIAGTATATAAPPSANNDVMAAAPNGVRDVLANDSDPDGSSPSMRIVANTQPDHGKVTCSALGTCFYEGDGGFTGADHFTYTVRDQGDEESTATVTVNVSENSTSSALIARDDDAATLAGTPVEVDVLANDEGGRPPVTVTSATQPSHGSVSCDQDSCTYTPDPGYTGTDGFRYTIEDTPVVQALRGARSAAGGQQASADVRLLVAPADTRYGLSVNGAAADGSAGGAVPSGGLAHWFAAVTSGPDGITGEELGALPLPTVTTKLDGPHSASGDMTTATGWKASTSGGATTLSATRDALLGEGVTEPFPKPLPPISQGTGGDGHVPILLGTKVFAFYHHSDPTSVACVDRATGLGCPGYPKQLDWNSTDVNGPGVVVGDKIYTFLFQGGSGNTVYGLYCWDARKATTCGYIPVARGTDSYRPAQSWPVEAAGKMWFAASTGKLYCVDPQTEALCTGTGAVDTGLSTDSGGSDSYDITTHGDLVYIARSGDKVSCVDATTRALCAGWDGAKGFGGRPDVINRYNASGEAIGICLVTYGGTGECITDGAPDTRTPIANWPRSDYYYSKSIDAETGTRTLVGSLGRGGMGCYDWTTNAPCTGGGYGSDGWIVLPYEQQAYGVAWDGSCAIGVGDFRQVYTVDPAGTAPCTSLRSGAKQKAIDLRDQRCDGGVGAARWRDVTLTDTNAEEMESITVTVRDARTKEVLATGNLVGGDGKLDLSGIDPKEHPAITVDANAKSRAGNTAWDDSIPPRITVRWKSDPQQACFDTRGASECGPSSPLGISVLGHLDAPARDEKAALDLIRNGCPAQPQAQPEPAKPVTATAVPKKCSGVRLFKIHVNYASKKVRSVKVTINGKKQKLLSMKGKPTFQVDLRGMGKQKATVRIELRTKSGKKLTGKRVYNPCTPKLPDRGFTL